MRKFQRVHIMVRSRTPRRNAAHAYLWRWPAAAGDDTTQQGQQAAAAIARYVRTARRQSASRYTAAKPRGIILLITDKMCTSERNLQRQIRGTLSRVPQKQSSAEMYIRKKRASVSRRALSWRKFEDRALDATLFFANFVLLRLAILFKAKRLFV